MIIIKLTGGLGNQLFQYAFGRSLNIKHNQPLYFDINFFKWDKLRKFSLEPFSINYKIADDELILKTKQRNFLWRDRILNVIFKKNIEYFRNSYIIEPNFKHDKNICNYRSKNVYFEGYWQCEKYFVDYRKIIIKEIRNFSLLSTISQYYLNEILKNNSVSIHIRRGDYISNDETFSFHGICDNKYYNTAIELLETKINNPHFFVFSDDIDYVEKMYPTNKNYTIVKKIPNDYEEIILMSACKNHIIANSSFSWWGAWLNPSEYKIVIAPKKWFQNKDMQQQTADLIPHNWIKI
jgi:hypothetical protein